MLWPLMTSERLHAQATKLLDDLTSWRDEQMQEGQLFGHPNTMLLSVIAEGVALIAVQLTAQD